MRKLGFTLSELLITLTIIGVVAAVTIPALNSALPDQDKVAVLKAYDTLSRANENLLEDKTKYLVEYGDGCVGLGCTGENNVVASEYGEYTITQLTGYQKYKTFLERELDTTATDVSNDFSIFSLTIPPNIPVTISHSFRNKNDLHRVKWGGLATVKLHPDVSDQERCTYSNSCQKPTDFAFIIHETGKLVPADALTDAYLKNRQKLNDKSNDYNTANDNLSNFNTTPGRLWLNYINN